MIHLESLSTINSTFSGRYGTLGGEANIVNPLSRPQGIYLFQIHLKGGGGGNKDRGFFERATPLI